MKNGKMVAKRHVLPSHFSMTVNTFQSFSSYWAKIVFQKFFRTFFRIRLSFLEAEIHRFFMLQLSWYTLYNWLCPLVGRSVGWRIRLIASVRPTVRRSVHRSVTKSTRPSRPIMCDVWIVERMRYPTDRPTNQPTDTASYRGALAHLKRNDS